MCTKNRENGASRRPMRVEPIESNQIEMAPVVACVVVSLLPSAPVLVLDASPPSPFLAVSLDGPISVAGFVSESGSVATGFAGAIS